MSIRDRKNIKWNPASFLPEHKKLLNDYWKEDKKVKKPTLDENEIEIINRHLSESLQESTRLLFKLYKSGYIEDLIGIVQQVDILQRRIKVIDDKEYIQFIKFDDLVGTEPL